MKPWWEQFPDRYKRELKELTDRGITFERDPNAWANGQLVLELTYAPDGKKALHFRATFPDTYPFTRFEVQGTDLTLPRHQNPFGKQLCFFGRSTRNWYTDDTLAGVLVERLPLVRAAAEEGSEARALEEAQGEPFTDFYPYLFDSGVLVDSSWRLDPMIPAGKLRLSVSQEQPLRGAILEVLDKAGAVMAEADPAIAGSQQGSAMPGRWVRLQAPIREDKPTRLLQFLCAQFPDLVRPRMHFQRGKNRPIYPDIIGVVFPEEVRQGAFQDSWIFVVRTLQSVYLARACRAGRADIAGRIPELAPLKNKRVAVIGLGALGAPSALEFARSGVGVLKMADYDFVEAGTIGRWPLGLVAAGRRKAHTIHEFILRNYPYTKVEMFPGMVGGAFQPDDYADRRHLDALLDCNLIYDSTAEYGIQNLLSNLAAERGIPYICVSTTEGAWGGLIARIRPGRTQGCWCCLQHAMNAGTIRSPAGNPSGHIQPIGCASPTYTGAGFDVNMIALAGVRLAVSTFCERAEDGYPETDWDVAVIDLRTADGQLITPHWETHVLTRHPDCANETTHSNRVVIGATA